MWTGGVQAQTGTGAEVGPTEAPAPAETPQPQEAGAARDAPPSTAAAVEAPSAQAQLPTHVSRFIASQRDESGRPCDVRGVWLDEPLYYVACGHAGVWVIRVAPAGPRMVLQRFLGGFVTGLFSRAGQVWAEVTRVSAEPVAELAGSGAFAFDPPSATASTQEPAIALAEPGPGPVTQPVRQARDVEHPSIGFGTQVGRVVSREGRTVMVEFPAGHGLTFGQHVAFTTSTDTIDTIAVGRIDRVGDTRVRVQLGVNEDVPLGLRAESTTADTSASSVAPPRAGDLWEVGVMARPFMSVDDDGGGVLMEAWAGRRFAGPLHLQVRLAPIGIAVGSDTTIPAAAYVMASWDLELFEVGFGVGGETVHDVEALLDPGSGLSFVEHVRLGARDGFNLTVYTHMVLFHSELHLDAGWVRLQIPLGGATWLVAGGGHGNNGATYGDIGLRALLSGNGGADSFFLTAVAGYAGVFEEKACELQPGFCNRETIELNGPMLGVGGEWRF